MNAKAIETAERLGWQVRTEEDMPGMEWVEFSKYTPAGQDFSFSVVAWENNMWSLCSKIDKYIEDFDADYEASLWAKDGHGIKGAPYRLKHIIEDMERAEDMMIELHKALAKLTVEEVA